jgi:spore maturation protein CgeB
MEQLVGGGTRWDRLKLFDRAFLAQKDRADETGGVWLPLAYDPAVYHPLDCERRYDWSFIGNLSEKRRAFFEPLQRELPNCFVGNAYFAEANRIYNESWLTLNLTFSNDVNMRFFEAQATNALLLSNAVNNGEEALFSAVEYFDGAEDCAAKMRALLSNKESLADKSERQRAQIAGHTYRARMQAMLAHIEAAQT